MSDDERARSEARRRSSQARQAERAQQAAEAVRDLARVKAAEVAKTSRLKALRLAKEAAERDNPPSAVAMPPRPRPLKAPTATVSPRPQRSTRGAR